MTKKLWLGTVEANKDSLRSLIARYHPLNLERHSPRTKLGAEITAPNAERACEVIRNQIRAESKSADKPEIMFDKALENQDASLICLLLSQAWFGVPESNSCWQIEGFSVAVDLLDDPVE